MIYSVAAQTIHPWINVNCPVCVIKTLFLSSSSLHFSLRRHAYSFLWSDWLLWEVTVNQTLGNSITTQTIYWNYIHFHCADTQANTNNRLTRAHPRVYILCTEMHPILTQVDGTHTVDAHSKHTGLGTKIDKERHERTRTHTCHALSWFCLLSIHQIPAYFGYVAPSRGRSVEGAHCREPHCQPTAPTLMTSSLCTIHQSRTCPIMIASAVYIKYVTFRQTAGIKITIQNKSL